MSIPDKQSNLSQIVSDLDGHRTEQCTQIGGCPQRERLEHMRYKKSAKIIRESYYIHRLYFPSLDLSVFSTSQLY